MLNACRGGQVATCRVLEVIADHSHCMAEHSGKTA
jgi:hypothetical protein